MPAGLACAFETCRRPVTGAEADRRIEVHRAGGALRTYGRGAPDGPLDQAAGPLVEVYHGRCWLASVKRERLLAARAADPSGQPAADWREQESCDVKDLRGVLGRDSGGAGAAPA